MPRYSINLDPFARPVSPASDALTAAVAQVTAAIERRREMEADREERDLARGEQRADREYTRQRMDRQDALSIEDRDYRRKQDDRRLTLEDEDRTTKAQDRQLSIERMANQEQRQGDRDAIDLFKMNEDLDYRDQQAAERQIQNMNIEDARLEANEAREQSRRDSQEASKQPRRLSFKEARTLAIAEAKAKAGTAALGGQNKVDEKMVEELTKRFMAQDLSGQDQSAIPPLKLYQPGDRQATGGSPGKNEPLPPVRRGSASDSGQPLIDPTAKRVLSILDGPEEVAEVPAAQPAPAPVPVPTSATPPSVGSGQQQASQQFMSGAGGWGNLYPSSIPSNNGSPQQTQTAPTAPAVNPNAPDPDPRYIDFMEQMSQERPEDFKEVLRKLKANNPDEYAAAVRSLSERAQRQQQMARVQAPRRLGNRGSLTPGAGSVASAP